MKHFIYLSILFILTMSHSFGSSYDPHDYDPHKTLTVLSIDGGGTRGIIPATILSTLQNRLDEDLIRYFDVTAGTSTGALIALGLNVPKNTDDTFSRPKFGVHDIVAAYEQQSPQIFSNQMQNYGSFNGLFRPKYSRDNLKTFMENFFQDTPFSHSITHAVIPTYDLNQGAPHFFRSYLARKYADCDYAMSDIALATSAAPGYFSPYSLESFGGYKIKAIDGGVIRNNPDLTAVAQGVQLFPDVEKIVVVSLGTGRENLKDTLSSYKPTWGRWISPLTEVLLSAPNQASEDDLHRLMESWGQTYYRLQIDLPHDLMALDQNSPDTLQELQARALNYMANHQDMLDNLTETLRYLKEQP